MTGKKQNEDNLLMDYLLGKLPPAEEVRIEEQYVTDSRQQQKLVEIEDELVDRYLEGQLSQEERRQFEGRFLSSPRGRSKLQLARSLIAVASEVSETQALPKSSKGPAVSFWRLLTRFPLRFAFAVMALVLLLVLAWFIRDRAGRGRGNMRAVNPKNSPASSSIVKPSESLPATPIAEIALQPLSRQVIHTGEVSIYSNTEQLRIQLEIEGNRNSYTARLLDSSRQIKWTGHGLRGQSTNFGRTVILLLPATLFESGEYTVVLNTDQEPSTPLAEYSFVIKKN